MAGTDSIEFFANYNGWVESRSMDITDSTKPLEIAYELATIREAVDRRAFDILGIDTKSLDSYSEKFSKLAPKGDYKSLAVIYKLDFRVSGVKTAGS